MAITGTLAWKIIIPVFLVRFPCLPCFKFTKEPQSPIITVLGHNTTNVNMKWKFEAEGSSVANCKIQRFLKNKDGSLSRETILVYFSPPSINAWNRTLYTFSWRLAASGYANFTIKDVLKRANNADQTKVSFLSGENYTYRLDVDTLLPSLQIVTEKSNVVNLHIYYGLKTITVPGAFQNVVLDVNSTDVKLTWTIDLEGDPLNQLKISRSKETDDPSNPATSIGIMYSSNNPSVFSTKYSLNASGLSSPPYAILTIKDVLNQSKNADGSEVDVLKDTYVFKLEVNVQNPLVPTLVYTVKLQVFAFPKITIFVCQGCPSRASIENQTITLFCNATGNPMPNITWIKNGDPFKSNNALVFQKFAISDSGNYTCIAYNGVGNADRKTIALFVNYKPQNTRIEISGDKNIFCEGDAIQVRCTSYGWPAPDYSLYRDNVFLGGNAIGLFAVQVAKKGNYIFTCVPNNTVGVGESKSELIIVKEPPKITDCRINGFVSTSKPVVEGSVVTVTCNTSGSVPLIGRWTKNWRVWNGSKLTFNLIRRTDAGPYRFITNNGDECQEAEKDIPLFVYYLDDLEVIGSSNQSYNQSDPVALFNLSVNAYPSNTTLSCKPSAPNILTVISSRDAGLHTKQYLVYVIIKSTVDSASIACKAEHSAGVRERTLHFYKRPINLKDSSPTQDKTLVAVLGVLLVLSIVLNIVFIAVFLWLHRKDSKGTFGKRSNNRDERGQMNDISLQETSLNATDKDTPNVPEYKPIGRQGLAASTGGIPEYEAVTTRTQPVQPQSGVQTNNPMPQYESADRHRLPGADSNPPSVTYQTIQPRTADYGSLSPSTRLPPKGTVLTSTGSPTSTGEYQTLQQKGVSPQYQSLDDLSRC